MELLSARHLFWIGVSALFVIGCINMRRLPRASRWHSAFRISLFVLILVNELSWFCYRHFSADLPLSRNLPLHLCDLSVFVMFAALATGKRLFAELSYYPGVVGALLAVWLPVISEAEAIRLIAEIRYFLTHIALVGVGFYLTFGCHYKPPLRAVFRSYLAILIYALAITPLNLYLGTNYFFTLSAPKEIAFALEYPHWLYVAVVSSIFLIVFCLMHLPFVEAQKRRQ